MRVTIHHIEKGPADMFPVDASQAVGHHPLEWSRVPWTDDAKSEAMPKLKEKRDAERKTREVEARERAEALNTYDPGGFKVVSPMAGQTQQAPAGGTASDPLTPPYAAEDAGGKDQRDDELTVLEKRADDQSKALIEAQTELDAAKVKGDDKAADKAQKKVDGLNRSLGETNAAIDAKLSAG